MTLYVRRNIRNAVKIRQFQEGRETSSLLENLLNRWPGTGRPE